jgi:hypothetical protein
MRPLEKQRQYSCTSRNVGLAADIHEPHAVEPDAPAALRQMTSPRMKYPMSPMRLATRALSGM